MVQPGRQPIEQLTIIRIAKVKESRMYPGDTMAGTSLAAGLESRLFSGFQGQWFWNVVMVVPHGKNAVDAVALPLRGASCNNELFDDFFIRPEACVT